MTERTAEIVETTVSDKIDQVGALLRAHWEELATDHTLMVLKPDVEKYAALERAGVLLSLCVFVDGEMVGYSVNSLGTNLHYSDLTVSTNDVLFLSAPYRNARLGMELMQATEAAAVKRGARMQIWHAKRDTALDALLQRNHYRVQDVMYSKEL